MEKDSWIGFDSANINQFPQNLCILQLFKLKHEDSFTYDVQLRSPNVEKAMEKLGFKTEIGLEESVEEVIVWMRKQHGL